MGKNLDKLGFENPPDLRKSKNLKCVYILVINQVFMSTTRFEPFYL
jgi:hypothetical protein